MLLASILTLAVTASPAAAGPSDGLAAVRSVLERTEGATSCRDDVLVRRLTALCRELQRAAGAGPFYLSCHTAGRLLGADPKSANRWLFFLEDEGILQTVEKGSNRTQRATRYRYLPPL